MKTGLARMAWLAPAVALASACLASSAGAQVVTDPVTGHKFGIVPQLASTSAANRASGRRRGLSLAAPFSAACNADGNDCTPLSYNGGPVQHAENDYLFFWAPTSYTPAFPPTYRAGLENWLNQVAAASNTNGNPFSVNQQYYDLSGPGSSKSFVPYAVHNAGTIVDTNPYPTLGSCPIAAGYTACVSDGQIRDRLANYISANHLATDRNTEFFVFTPQGVETCFDSSGSSCSSSSYCGYHDAFTRNGNETTYADMPWLYGDGGCDIAGDGSPHAFGYPNTNFIDPVVGVFSHELSETMTDPEPDSGWVQSGGPDDGYEVGDKCSYIYGAGGYLSSSGLPRLGNLAYYNVQLGSGLGSNNYLLQLEFDNQLATCEGSLQEPASTSVPAVSGTAAQGQTLSEGHGSWSPTATIYSYQWQDCDSGGANCSAISGATAQAYTLAAADVGHTIRVQETATNDFGASTPVSSAATSVVIPLVPSSSTAPRVSGALQQAQALTESHGTWSNTPTGFSYQWEDCNAAGAGCSAIAGAIGQTYTLTAADIGHAIRVLETASNAGGAGTAVTSAATTTVIPLAPSAATSPAINGTYTEGRTLSEAHGTWLNGPTSYTYQWQDCSSSGGGCSAIAGATAQSYRLTTADIGHKIRVLETAANAGGTGGAASSPATALVGPSAAHVSKALSTVAAPRGANATTSRVLSHNGYSLSFSAPSRGSLQISWRDGRVLVATAHFTAPTGGVYRRKLVLTAAGRRLLRQSGRIQIRSSATFRPAGGTAITLTKRVTLRA